tara:strand:+ start:156 stop:308 length:153 start_codon:yes stop_codon:yes gene_type:complete
MAKKNKNKKSNVVLDTVEKHLTRTDNVSPASKFIKRQKRLQQMLNDVNAN